MLAWIGVYRLIDPAHPWIPHRMHGNWPRDPHIYIQVASQEPRDSETPGQLLEKGRVEDSRPTRPRALRMHGSPLRDSDSDTPLPKQPLNSRAIDNSLPWPAPRLHRDDFCVLVCNLEHRPWFVVHRQAAVHPVEPTELSITVAWIPEAF
jgi:hypothetical protein